jgi:mono/diheme cytochrome c family protein
MRRLAIFTAVLPAMALLSAAGLPSSAVAGDAAKGQSIYERNCLACHGTGGAGDGPAARALRPAPKPFNSADFWSNTTDEKVQASIKTGRPGTSMMAFGSLADLVTYLRTFAPAQ